MPTHENHLQHGVIERRMRLVRHNRDAPAQLAPRDPVHRISIDRDRAVLGAQYARHQPEERCLAATVRPEKSCQASPFDIQGKGRQREAAIVTADAYVSEVSKRKVICEGNLVDVDEHDLLRRPLRRNSNLPGCDSRTRKKRAPGAGSLRTVGCGGQCSMGKISEGFRVKSRISAAGLSDIEQKLQAGKRLDFDDGVRLFRCGPAGCRMAREPRARAAPRCPDVLQLQPAAGTHQRLRRQLLFCSFARLKPTDAAAYTMSLEKAWDKLRQRADQPLTEIHIVNGLNPDLPFAYYTELLRGFRGFVLDIHLKCFTAVEIAFFADLYGMTDAQVLRELMAAGLDSLPGAAPRSSPSACAARSVMTSAAPIGTGDPPHGARHGYASNVTMLYGHIETFEERVDHMLRVRALQDDEPAGSRPSSRSRSTLITTRCESFRRRPRPTP